MFILKEGSLHGTRKKLKTLDFQTWHSELSMKKNTNNTSSINQGELCIDKEEKTKNLIILSKHDNLVGALRGRADTYGVVA